MPLVNSGHAPISRNGGPGRTSRGIRIRGARKEFWGYQQHVFTKVIDQRTQVFSSVDLAIAPGEFVVIIGPSGCGKTTLLRCIAGIDRLNAGSIEVNGAKISHPRRGSAMVFQSGALFPWLTVRENVELAFTLDGTRRVTDSERARAASWIEVVGLGGTESQYPRQLSGGMQQRVAIARALASEPDTLLMDEPFGALDAQTRAVMQEETLRLYDRLSCTVVFVTHDLEEAIVLADRVLVMNGSPATMTYQLDIPWPRPRTIDDIRGDARFEEMREDLWRRLRTGSRIR